MAGGVWPGDDQPSGITEKLLESATAWHLMKPLPSTYDVLTNALITVDNVVYLLGNVTTTTTTLKITDFILLVQVVRVRSLA